MYKYTFAYVLGYVRFRFGWCLARYDTCASTRVSPIFADIVIQAAINAHRYTHQLRWDE